MSFECTTNRNKNQYTYLNIRNIQINKSISKYMYLFKSQNVLVIY